MSMLLNATNSSSLTAGANSKIDCVKECPCGVPAIPVPDQWLEVMVTGGFKVWHIIFILIAFVVTIVVVYCCFHRCRIPRTKQEIEADLMRTNLASKFRDYLQEFPNEPTTFIEALKKVQELEEKSSEQDDYGARKRKGWLKLKVKEKPDKNEGTKDDKSGGQEKESNAIDTTVDGKQQSANCTDDAAELSKTLTTKTDDTIEPAINADQVESVSLKPLDFATMQTNLDKSKSKVELTEAIVQPKTSCEEKKSKSKESKLLKIKVKGALDKAPSPPARDEKVDKKPNNSIGLSSVEATSSQTTVNKTVRLRKRKDKPSLSRTKAAHAGSQGGSEEKHNQLELPSPSHHHHHQQHNRVGRHELHKDGQEEPGILGLATEAPVHQDKQAKSKNGKEHHKQAAMKPAKSKQLPAARTKAKAAKESTVIQIEPLPDNIQPRAGCLLSRIYSKTTK